MKRRFVSGARWFAAEFLVVVTGVLVALAVQAFYQHRGDLERERHYLEQIAADLRDTERLLAQADTIARLRDRSGPLLLRAYHTDADRDSVFVWLANVTQSIARDPVMGTLEALVNSGDLSLIRNDSLRSSIARYVTLVHGRMKVGDDYNDSWRAGLGELSRRVDLNQVRRHALPGAALAGIYADSMYSPLSTGGVARVPFPTDPDAILRDRDVYTALNQMNAAKWVLSAVRARIIEGSQALRRAIEAELAD